MYCGSKEDCRAEMEKAAKLIQQGEIQITEGLNHAETYWQGDLACEYIKDFLNHHEAVWNKKISFGM